MRQHSYFYLSANLKLSYAQKIYSQHGSNGFQLVWLHELNVGQYLSNYMQGLRIYLLNWNNDVVADEGVPTISAISDATPVQKTKKIGLSLFVTPRLKAVFHNATITGKLLSKSSVHTLPSSDLNRAVMEYDAGLTFRFYFLRLGYFLYGRSREYRQEMKSFHNWGGPYIGFIARF